VITTHVSEQGAVQSLTIKRLASSVTSWEHCNAACSDCTQYNYLYHDMLHWLSKGIKPFMNFFH
jgi:hypothetical protein